MKLKALRKTKYTDSTWSKIVDRGEIIELVLDDFEVVDVFRAKYEDWEKLLVKPDKPTQEPIEKLDMNTAYEMGDSGSLWLTGKINQIIEKINKEDV